MVGGFPKFTPRPPKPKAPDPKSLALPTVDAREVEFDEDGRLLLTAPISSAELRPAPMYAQPDPPKPVVRPLPPRPPAPARTTAVKPPTTSRPLPRIPHEQLLGSRPAARDVNGQPTTLNPDDIPY